MNDDLYREAILDHNDHPRNFGELAGANVSAQQQNASCGDEANVQLRVEDGIVRAVGFTGQGCAISQAATSMVTERLIDMHVEDVLAMGEEDITELLGVTMSPMRMKCALLGLQTIQRGLRKQAR